MIAYSACSENARVATNGKIKQNRDKVKQRDKYFLAVLKKNTYRQLFFAVSLPNNNENYKTFALKILQSLRSLAKRMTVMTS